MPILVNFLPCIVVVLDAFTNRVSAFSILDSVQPSAQIAPPVSTTDPSGDSEQAHLLIGPIQVLSHWRAEEGDHGQQFEQRILLRAPGGSVAILQPPAAFVLERPFHRMMLQVPILAVPVPGTYHLVLQLRRSGETGWSTVKEYPLLVQEIPTEQETEQAIEFTPSVSE
jgi:hypothetical protein